jgi:hypothetical protein
MSFGTHSFTLYCGKEAAEETVDENIVNGVPT